MKRLILLLLLISIFEFPGYSGHINENTARVVAKSYFKKVLDINDISPSDFILANKYVESEALIKDNQNEVVYFYIFNLTNGKGFIIVSGDDNVEPILGYSKEGIYKNTNLPPNFQFWLDGYKNQIKELIKNKIPGSEKTKLKWEKLINETYTLDELNKKSSAEPLIETTWDQTAYYNSKCPGGSMTGCVATAMSQIIKYWKYPAQGIGYHSYNLNYYGDLYVDYANTTFDYANMPYTLNDNSTQEEIDAVGTLMYSCGVSVEMMYSPSGSYSYVILADSLLHYKNPYSCAENAYKTFFGYNSKTLKGLRRANYSDTEWKDLLKTDLDNKQPVQYAGLGTGGHTWVCDGYDANDYFHMNWGWSGQSNGFYHLDSLYPNIFNNYSLGESAILGIQPALLPDIYESNDSQVAARTFPLVWSDNKSEVKTTGSNINTETDIDYYKIYLEAGYKYTITARVHDGKNSANGTSYSCDVMWSYDDGNGWSSTYDDLMPGNIIVKEEGMLIFKVEPYSEGLTGSYLLDINLERANIDGINELGIKNEELEIFPNPAASLINIENTTKFENLKILNSLGQNVFNSQFSHHSSGFSIDLSNLSNGIYYLEAINNDKILYRKFIINK